MKPRTVDIRESTGRILCCTIFRPSGRKLLGKGHVLNEEDVRLLETEGLGQVWVTELEDGEIGEDEAVSQAAQEIGCGCLEIRLAAGGRANLFATEDCCVLVDDDLLKQVNGLTSVVIATTPNFSFARTGQRIATVKSAPFAVAQTELEAVIKIVKERGPILQARPVRSPTVGVLYSDPVHGDRARQLFESILRQTGAVRRGAELRSLVHRGGRRRCAQPAAPHSRQADGGSGGIDHGARWPGRRHWPGHDSYRVPHRTFPRSGRARQFVHAGL